MRIFKILRFLVFLSLGLIVLYAGIGFLGVPWAAKKYGVPELAKMLDRPVVLRELAFDPFAFNLKLEGFEIYETDGTPLVGFEQLFVNFEATSVLDDAYRFDIIRLSLPFGLVKILKDGRLNLAELGPKGGSGEPSEPETIEPAGDPSEDKPILIEIGLLAIEQGAVEFRDESKPTPFVEDIVPIQIKLRNFSTRPGNQNSYFVEAELGEGERLQWQGKVSLDPIRSQGRVEIAGLRSETMWQYVQDLFRFEVTQGMLDLDVSYDIDMAQDPMGIVLDKGTITLRNFALREKGQSDELIVVPSFSVRGIEANVGARKVSVDSIQSRGAEIRGWINREGIVNYQTLFAGQEESETSHEAELSQSQMSEDLGVPWVATIKKISLEEYAVRFEDRQPGTPVPLHIEGFGLQVQNVTTDLTKSIALEMGLIFNQSGKLTVNGQVTPEPLTGYLKLDLSGFSFLPFQPYLEPFVQFQVERGALSFQGHTAFSTKEGQDPMVRVSGDVTIEDFALVDAEASEEFLRWEELAFRGIALESQPTRVDLREIVVTLPYANVVQSKDGILNVSRMFSPPGSHANGSETEGSESEEKGEGPQESSSDSEPKEDSTPLITIDTIQINNAAMDFTDQAIDPNVVTGLQNFTGTIKGLSSKKLSRADVSLKGRVDDVATLEIQGQVNPLQDDLYSDVALIFRNLDLTTASPYAGKFIGYPTTKGKLSLDLNYSLSEKILIGENKVTIDQLTLGDATDSPDAPSLPVPLALALLKDRDGKIDIDLPVRGDLNNPEFSYGQLVLQTLVNLIAKAATSPFSLIGGLLGGSAEDLANVKFSAGDPTLPVGEIEKLSTLASALSQRPGLRLEIAGGTNPVSDGAEIGKQKLDEELKQLRQEELAASDQAKSSPEKELSPLDRDRLLKKLFLQKFGDKLLKEGGVAEVAEESSLEDTAREALASPPKKPLPSLVEMRERLLDGIQISEAELRLLAQERARSVRDHLVNEEKISEERIFLVEPNLASDVAGSAIPTNLTLTAQ